MIWVDWVIENFDCSFVAKDPRIGPQEIDWKYYVGDGLPDWDGRYDERYNFGENVGGVYESRDDEKVSFHLNCSIEMIEKNEEKIKRKGLRPSLRKLWTNDDCSFKMKDQ